MRIYRYGQEDRGLSREEIEQALLESLEGKELKKVLILPPDITRFHSNAGLITNLYYHALTGRGVAVDIMPCLGTHVPMTEEECARMYGDIPFDRFIPHDWKNDVVKIGQIPGDYIASISDGVWEEPLDVEVNRRIMDPSYDLILSVGQVVPHEVIGMSNHAKNLFVGAGGSRMINCSHMIGALYGMERMMGRDHTPVRKLFDYGLEHFLCDRPILFVLTVTTAVGTDITTHGLFISEERDGLEKAVALAQEKNMDFVDTGIKKCVVYLDPSEFRSTWLGNKSVYRTRMAMADGGELIVLAPGVDKFGEDPSQEVIIRKYGYTGRLHILEKFRDPDCGDLRENMGTAAHLIHGSSDGRFNITYCVRKEFMPDVASVGFRAADIEEMLKVYDPGKLEYGYNEVEGEEIYFIPNPALGLWIDRERFKEEG